MCYPLLILPPLVRNVSFKPLICGFLRRSLMGIRKRKIVRAGVGFIVRNIFISAI